MLRPYDLLENVLLEVEKGVRNGVNGDVLSAKFTLSERHLRRLFKFAFKQSIAGYIRSRKLAASLEDLLKTDSNILHIALDYGFEYEHTYIRAFKREFGITPGDLRKTGKTVKIKPPLYLLDENNLPDGVLFGPDIVMVQKFHVIGKRYSIPLSAPTAFGPEMGIKFWENERKLIKSTVNPNVYIGISKNIEDGHTDYLTSIQVKTIENIPQGLCAEIFETSLCARFRYIGKLHYYELNRNTARALYSTIWDFFSKDKSGYTLTEKMLRFEKVDTRLYDGTYCQMEWYAPIQEKPKNVRKCLSLPDYYCD